MIQIAIMMMMKKLFLLGECVGGCTDPHIRPYALHTHITVLQCRLALGLACMGSIVRAV